MEFERMCIARKPTLNGIPWRSAEKLPSLAEVPLTTVAEYHAFPLRKIVSKFC